MRFAEGGYARCKCNKGRIGMVCGRDWIVCFYLDCYGDGDFDCNFRGFL